MKLATVNGNGIDLAHLFSITYCRVVNGLAYKTIPDSIANTPSHLECLLAYGTSVYTMMTTTVTRIAHMCCDTVPGSMVRSDKADSEVIAVVAVGTYRT